LQREAALGNGTRPRGFVLGDFQGESPAKLVECVMETPAKSLASVPLPPNMSIRLSDGVEDGEILTALRNGELVAFVDLQPPPMAELDDMPEFPEAGDPQLPASSPPPKARRKK